MTHLFARRPAPQYDDYTTVHLGAGKRYHQVFSLKPGLAMIWELERLLLRDIVAALNPEGILDFACGTGRISHFIETTFPEPEVHGIDVSESMLSIAQETCQRAQYRVMQSHDAVSFYGEKHFDLIVSFRFFANAEPSLRKSAAENLSRLISDDGTLVVNNHRNFWSISYLGRRIIGQKPVGARNADIERLFEDEGFRVKRTISLGVWPQGDTHAFALPWKAVEFVERANLRLLAPHHALGYNTIWLLSKAA
jgi:SAM-dependent methyltransferase